MISVFVYCALTPEVDIKSTARFKETFVNFIRNNVDFYLWKLLKIWRFHYYHFECSYYSNVGDTAIRQSVEEQLKSSLEPEDVMFTYLQWGHLNDEIVSIINEKADLFVIGGSGYLHINQDGCANELLFHDLSYLKKLHCPILAYGIGINQIIDFSKYDRWDEVVHRVRIDNSTNDLFRQFSRLSKLIMVRDDLSAKYLPNFGNIVISCDPALFLEKKFPVDVERKENVIGINFAYHGKYTSMIFKNNFVTFQKLCHEISNVRKFHLKYFRHSPSECVVIDLLRNSGVDIEVIEGSPREMLKEYATCRAHICQMLHSAILATNAGVPVVNIGYDIKNIGFFRRIGGVDNCIIASGANVENILRRLDICLEEGNEYCKNLEERKIELKSTMHSVHGRIRSLCRNKSRVESDQLVQRRG